MSCSNSQFSHFRLYQSRISNDRKNLWLSASKAQTSALSKYSSVSTKPARKAAFSTSTPAKYLAFSFIASQRMAAIFSFSSETAGALGNFSPTGDHNIPPSGTGRDFLSEAMHQSAWLLIAQLPIRSWVWSSTTGIFNLSGLRYPRVPK